jgi:hypothetical protein
LSCLVALPRLSLPPLRVLWTAYECDRFAVTELGTGGEGIPVVLGIDLLRHAGDQVGLASPRRRPCSQARSPSQPFGRTQGGGGPPCISLGQRELG